MTICLYHNKTLYSDRAGVAISRPSLFLELIKLYVDTTKHFAMVVSGSPIPKDALYRANMRELGKLLKEAEPFEASIKLTTGIEEMLKDCQVILMTYNRIYLLDNDRELLTMDLTVPIANGTGASFAIIALQAGHTALEAMKVASLTDPCSYLTEIDSIKMSDLKPYHKKLLKKAIV